MAERQQEKPESRKLLQVFFILFFLVAPRGSFAVEMPPTDAKPLSQIIKQLEDQGYSPIVDVSMDDNVWEIEAYKDKGKARA